MDVNELVQKINQAKSLLDEVSQQAQKMQSSSPATNPIPAASPVPSPIPPKPVVTLPSVTKPVTPTAVVAPVVVAPPKATTPVVNSTPVGNPVPAPVVSTEANPGSEVTAGAPAEERISSVGLIGIFDGEFVVMESGKRFQVPPNYASKSKLVVGDKLKLMKEGEYNEFKMMGEAPRAEVVGLLTKKDNQWVVLIDNHEYRVIPAAIRFYGGEMGDKVEVLLPMDYAANPPKWAAVKSVIKSAENAARKALEDERLGGSEMAEKARAAAANKYRPASTATPAVQPPLVPETPSSSMPTPSPVAPPAKTVVETNSVPQADNARPIVVNVVNQSPAPASVMANIPNTPKEPVTSSSNMPLEGGVDLPQSESEEKGEGESVIFDDIPDLR